MQAQGDASAMFAPMFKANIVASLGDLAARLERPGARFLDIGVGVASLAIAMCRAWQGLHTVGLDTFDVPLDLARRNIERAGLADRIELRRTAVEDLREEEAFDLAWMPSIFIPAPVLASAAARVRAALRPGGWMLFPIGGLSGNDERARAVFALISETWGGARPHYRGGRVSAEGGGLLDRPRPPRPSRRAPVDCRPALMHPGLRSPCPRPPSTDDHVVRGCEPFLPAKRAGNGPRVSN